MIQIDLLHRTIIETKAKGRALKVILGRSRLFYEGYYAFLN